MKKNILLFLCFTLVSYTQLILAQTKAIEYANDLIAQRKYASAYAYLNGADPNNQSPRIAIARVNLLLNFNIGTDFYEIFFLKDLAPNESIEDYENYDKFSTTLDRIDFSPDSILNKLAYQYPNNFQLRKTLGNFYYEVYLDYQGDNWIHSDSTLIKKIAENYLVAYQNDVYDYWSLFGLGYVSLLQQNYDKAITYLGKSIQLESNYALSYYDLAYAYYQKKDFKQALAMGKIAFEKQEIQVYKAEASRLLGLTYQQLGDKKEAYHHLSLAYELSPKDYLTLTSLLDMELALKKSNSKERTAEIFLLSPDNPSVYEDIMNAYSRVKELDKFVDFLEEQKAYYRMDDLVLSNIYLYTGIALYEQGKWIQSKINFEKARGLFGRIYEEQHNVFKVIDSYTDVIEKKKVGKR